MNKNINGALICALLVIAAILRLYKPFDIPYNSDELSALFRLNFPTFSEVVQKGIKLDGHPAGVQVFLYFWTSLFGISEIAVKLPFILMGIASVFLTYKIGKTWFNPMTGLLSAALIATLQYTIMYSQWARPYSSGLFFSLLMVWYWDKVIFREEKNYNLHLAFFILSAAACAYNHHFSLLFAFIVGITGLFYVKKKNLFKYIGAGIMIFILYIPHLEIFFFQLGVGGVEGWLAKPTPDFIFNYIKYIFHHSPFFMGLIVVLTAIPFILKKKAKPENKYYLISLSWFVLPLLTGYFYSVYFEAVLQFSVLLFSFPFLLFLFFGHIPDLKPSYKAGLVALVCIFSIGTLVFGRDYYTLGYICNFERNMQKIQEVKNSLGKDVIVILDGFKDVNEYYLNKYPVEDVVWLHDFENNRELITFLDKNPGKNLAVGLMSNTHPDVVPLILDRYPEITGKEDYFLGSYYQFSTVPANNKSLRKDISAINFETPDPEWENILQEKYTDSVSFSGKFSYLMDSLQEWGPSFSFSLKDHISHRNDFIDVSAMVFPVSEAEEILIVSVIESEGKVIDWRATGLNDYRVYNGNWEKIYHSVKLSDIAKLPDDAHIKIFIWNKSRSRFFTDDFLIKVRQGNRFLYSIFEDF